MDRSIKIILAFIAALAFWNEYALALDQAAYDDATQWAQGQIAITSPQNLQQSVETNAGDLCGQCDANAGTADLRTKTADGKAQAENLKSEGFTVYSQECAQANPPPHCKPTPGPTQPKDSALIQGSQRALLQLETGPQGVPTQVCQDRVDGGLQTCPVFHTVSSATAEQTAQCHAVTRGVDWSVQFQGTTPNIDSLTAGSDSIFMFHRHGSGQQSAWIKVNNVDVNTIEWELNAVVEDKFGCTNASPPGQIVSHDFLDNSPAITGSPNFCNSDCSCNGELMQVVFVSESTAVTSAGTTETLAYDIHWGEHVTRADITRTIAIDYVDCQWDPIRYSQAGDCAVIGEWSCQVPGPPYAAPNTKLPPFASQANQPLPSLVPVDFCPHQAAQAICREPADTSACDAYANACSLVQQRCLFPSSESITAACEQEERSYQCEETCVPAPPQQTDGLDAGNPQVQTSEFSNDLPRTAAYLAMLDEAAGNTTPCSSAEQSANCVRIFPGDAEKCSIDLVCDYCSCDGLVGSCACENQTLKEKRDKNLCTYVGQYCSQETVLGVCLNWRDAYCCFNGILARIIQEQGRAQLGLGMGSPETPDCEGLTVSQLQQIDWSQIDFSEFLATLPQPEVPSTTDVQQQINDWVQSLN